LAHQEERLRSAAGKAGRTSRASARRLHQVVRMEKPKWKDSLPDARTVSVPTGQVAARVADGRWPPANPTEVGSCRDGAAPANPAASDPEQE
jgi:hypothetical protein